MVITSIYNTYDISARGLIIRQVSLYVMDKYLMVILALLVGGMIIMATQERWLPFYGMLAGAIIVIMYSSYKNRREYKRKRR
ncbi:MAG: hypothetical protein F4Y18_07415 [Cenarchaeum sp. SB0663_bin_5]|nr:hypothetical protein [Cenarchaeum sp. SB0663_bin_5]